MTQTISLPNESNVPTNNCETVIKPPADYCTVEELMVELEQIQGVKEHIPTGRAWIADTFYTEEGDTIRTRRLHNGWSQTQLAEKLGTSQSHVARMEGRYADKLLIGTCRKLCEVFQIDMNTLDTMLRRQQKHLGDKPHSRKTPSPS